MPRKNDMLERIIRAILNDLISAQGIHGIVFYLVFVGGVELNMAPKAWSAFLLAPAVAVFTGIISAFNKGDHGVRQRLMDAHEQQLLATIAEQQKLLTLDDAQLSQHAPDQKKYYDSMFYGLFTELHQKGVAKPHQQNVLDRINKFNSNAYLLMGQFMSFALPALIFQSLVKSYGLGDPKNQNLDGYLTVALLTIAFISMAVVRLIMDGVCARNTPKLSEREAQFLNSCDSFIQNQERLAERVSTRTAGAAQSIQGEPDAENPQQQWKRLRESALKSAPTAHDAETGSEAEYRPLLGGENKERQDAARCWPCSRIANLKP